MKKEDLEIVEIDEILVRGVTYVPKGTCCQNITGDAKIVVLQRGWVYIGIMETNGEWCSLKNAYCIRVWGTTKGLPELVNGPTDKTILDKCEGVVGFHAYTIINTIAVNIEKWKGLL